MMRLMFVDVGRLFRLCLRRFVILMFILSLLMSPVSVVRRVV